MITDVTLIHDDSDYIQAARPYRQLSITRSGTSTKQKHRSSVNNEHCQHRSNMAIITNITWVKIPSYDTTIKLL